MSPSSSSQLKRSSSLGHQQAKISTVLTKRNSVSLEDLTPNSMLDTNNYVINIQPYNSKDKSKGKYWQKKNEEDEEHLHTIETDSLLPVVEDKSMNKQHISKQHFKSIHRNRRKNPKRPTRDCYYCWMCALSGVIVSLLLIGVSMIFLSVNRSAAEQKLISLLHKMLLQSNFQPVNSTAITSLHNSPHPLMMMTEKIHKKSLQYHMHSHQHFRLKKHQVNQLVEKYFDDNNHFTKLEIKPVERKTIGTIYINLLHKNVDLFVEIMKGAHVIISKDRGWYYSRFEKLTRNFYTRSSSHFSLKKQYAIPQGELLSTLLIGTTSSRDTWFQFEGARWAPWSHPLDSILHILNYFEYKIRGVQVGPLGTSKYTDSNPLYLTFQQQDMFSRTLAKVEALI